MKKSPKVGEFVFTFGTDEFQEEFPAFNKEGDIPLYNAKVVRKVPYTNDQDLIAKFLGKEYYCTAENTRPIKGMKLKKAAISKGYMVFQTSEFYGWVKNNQLHREDGPALIPKDSSLKGEYYMKKGKIHREDGPACLKVDECKYYIDGVRAYNVQQFVQLVLKHTKNRQKALLSGYDLLELSGVKDKISLR